MLTQQLPTEAYSAEDVGGAISGNGQAASAGRPLRVLVAEDNPINQTIVCEIVLKLGHFVDLAADGRAALAALGCAQYDAVLMDVQMPYLDGVQTTQQIRALGDRIVQPYIIALTTSNMPGDRERFLAAGMDDYLHKPVDLVALRAALEQTGRVTTPLAPSEGVIDWHLLAELLTMLGPTGRQTVLRLINIMRNDVPSQLDQIERAIADDDRLQIRTLTHKVRGGSRQLGAVGLGGKSAALEHAASNASPETLAQLLNDVRAAHTQALGMLAARFEAGE